MPTRRGFLGIIGALFAVPASAAVADKPTNGLPVNLDNLMQKVKGESESQAGWIPTWLDLPKLSPGWPYWTSKVVEFRQGTHAHRGYLVLCAGGSPTWVNTDMVAWSGVTHWRALDAETIEWKQDNPDCLPHVKPGDKISAVMMNDAIDAVNYLRANQAQYATWYTREIL